LNKKKQLVFSLDRSMSTSSLEIIHLHILLDNWI